MSGIRFVYPTDGDMLTDAAGTLRADGALWIDVAVEAAEAPCIQGRTAERSSDGLWKTRAALCDCETVLTAQAGGEATSITVHRVPNATGKYALSVDDNIWWLAELTRHPRQSLFDHPYLAVFRRAHEAYGAKVRLNLFYETKASWAEKKDTFDLSMMTDRYKEEFRANSDWLKLAFHSLREEPCHPYRGASYDEVYADCSAVHREIVRFAGAESLAGATTIHFGRCTPEGIRALGDAGVRQLMGFMTLDDDGVPSVSYNLSPERVLQTQRYGFWRDAQSGMTYGKIDVVMNNYSPEGIAGLLEKEHLAHPLRGFTEIMIHEQYFYEDYSRYEPDFEERIMAGCRWCCENGYAGAFAEEALG